MMTNVGRSASILLLIASIFTALLCKSLTTAFGAPMTKPINPFTPCMTASSSTSPSSSTPGAMAATAAKTTRKTKTTESEQSKRRRSPLYSFVEARRMARGHGFATMKEFLEYECAGAYQVPKNADELFADEWLGWDNFLGLPLSSFDKARQVARTLNVQSQDEYMKLFRDKKLNEDLDESRLPFRPDLKFKGEWISWDDYLIG